MSPSRGAQLLCASPQSFLKSALSLIYWLMAKGSLEGPCLMLKLWHHLSDLFQVLSRWTPNSSNEDTTLEHITQVINDLDFTRGSPLFSLANGARKFRYFPERRDQDIFFFHTRKVVVSRNIKEIWDNSDLETPENDICENNQESLPMVQSYIWAFGDKKTRGICFEDVVINEGKKRAVENLVEEETFRKTFRAWGFLIGFCLFFKTKGHTSAATWQGVIGIPRLGRTGVSRTR